MGIISNLFGSSGKAERQHSGGSPPAAASSSSQPNVWRSVFDPGSNPNIDRVGSAYYDTVHKAADKAGTTWDQILKAQDFKRRSFSELDKDRDGFIDAKELSAALPPSVKADAGSLIQQAKPAQEGKLTRKEFNDVLDKYFLA